MNFIQSGQGRSLVLVHGALTDGRMWHAIEPLLARYYRVYSVTMRGFCGGEPLGCEPLGDKPPGEDASAFGYDGHAAELGRFLAEVVGEPALVVAWSYGADVVLAAAREDASQIRAAFLYEPGRHTHLAGAALQAYFADASGVFGKVGALLEAGDLTAALRELIDGTAGRSGYFERQDERDRAIQQENASTLPLQLGQAPSRELTCGEIAAIPAPMCFARGEHTLPLFALASDGAYQCAANATHRVVAGANHMFPLEAPGEFFELVLEYFGVLDAA